jgi:hypothetical protein
MGRPEASKKPVKFTRPNRTYANLDTMSHATDTDPYLHKSETTVTRVDLNNQEVPDGESCLIVFYGQNIGRRYFLNRPELILGRSDAAGIQVDQDSVSRNRAKITIAPGKSTYIEDLDSTNGTFVNNRRIWRGSVYWYIGILITGEGSPLFCSWPGHVVSSWPRS